MKKYVDLFIDFDDTLYDTYGNAVIALAETFDAFRLDRFFERPQAFYDAYWEANIDLWRRYAKGEITRDYLIVERFRRPLLASETIQKGGGEAERMLEPASILQMSDRFLDFCASKSGVIEGAHELMENLKQKGYRMHMTSNGFHEVQYKKLDSCGLRAYFDTIILSEDAGANKPSRHFFDYALQRAGAKRDTTLMIGDNMQTDIQGALASGIDGLLFNRWQVTTADGELPPTFVVDSLQEIMTIL
jgi:putative hydrolase of the HAD superfamily